MEKFSWGQVGANLTVSIDDVKFTRVIKEKEERDEIKVLLKKQAEKPSATNLSKIKKIFCSSEVKKEAKKAEKKLVKRQIKEEGNKKKETAKKVRVVKEAIENKEEETVKSVTNETAKRETVATPAPRRGEY